MTPIVLVHGGGFDHRCWDLLVPHLTPPTLAVDLPGRGQHPADLRTVTFADCAASVLADVDGAGFDEIVLVGHSLAGASMPAIIGALGDRVRHTVFVACTVPEDGMACIDTLDPEVQQLIRDNKDLEPRVMDEAIAALVLGEDLDAEQFAWCVERLVAEAPRLTTDLVDLSPMRSGMPRTWIRTLQDAIVPAEKQVRFAANVGDCPVVDVDAGHMVMVSQPEHVATILHGIAD